MIDFVRSSHRHTLSSSPIPVYPNIALEVVGVTGGFQSFQPKVQIPWELAAKKGCGSQGIEGDGADGFAHQCSQ